MSIRTTRRKKFDLERIAKNCALDRSVIENVPIGVEELKSIFDDFVSSDSAFTEAKTNILTVLNNRLQGKFHSIRVRTKDPDHLIGKIVRNIYEKPEKYRKITVDNYNKIITDLIGVRIIILNKHDWKAIHEELLEVFLNEPERYADRTDLEAKFDEYTLSDEEKENPQELLQKSYHAEEPVVYITSKTDWEEYKAPNLRIDSSREHYRSIHYIIRYGDFYFEIQVRTLFEEGWLEFDHRVKYPNDRSNPKKAEYIAVLNSLAVAADRLIAFYNEEDFKNKPSKSKSSSGTTGEGEVPPAAPVTLAEKIIFKY